MTLYCYRPGKKFTVRARRAAACRLSCGPIMQSCGTVCGPRTFAAALLSKRLPHICMLRDGMRQTAAALDRSISRAAPTIQGPSSSFFFFYYYYYGRTNVQVHRSTYSRISKFDGQFLLAESFERHTIQNSVWPAGDRSSMGGRPAGWI